MHRVVITGAGTVNPLGTDVPATFAAFDRGVSAIGPLQPFTDIERLSIRIGAQVAGFPDETRFSEDELSLSDRATLMALQAGREAVVMAGLDPSGPRAGAIIGTAGGGHGTGEAAYRAVFAEGRPRVHPFTVPRLMSSGPASRLSIAFGLRGPVMGLGSACASATHAIAMARLLIGAGQADAMLAGGTEAMVNFSGLKVWEALRVLSPEGCHPFAAGRRGMVLGEGAAVFVLERRDRALARGARVLAEIVGAGMTADAADMLLPSPDGMEAAMRGAMAEAGLSPADIGLVNAHATGTDANDRAEAEVLVRIFGRLGVPVQATKAATGHLIGASGAVEVLASLHALQGGVIAPTAGGQGADPALGVDLVGPDDKGPRRLTAPALLTSSFAFGGLNAVLALRLT